MIFRNDLFRFFICLMLITSCTGNHRGRINSTGSGKCYYVSPKGDDTNPGSIIKPWKTISKVSNTDLNPGDSVLLEGGAVFRGTLILDSADSGDANKKVVIGSYGKERATINAAASEGIIVRNCKNFVIRSLIIEGSGRKDGNITDGVFITQSDSFNIDSLELFGFQHSGLHIRICSDAIVKNIYAHDNGFAGIHLTGTTIYDTVNYDNRNIYLGYCTAENNPGDPTVLDNHSGNGILASSVKGGTIEYCEAFNNGWDMPWTGNGPVGIWLWDCSDVKIQYCISHDNKTRPGAKDGGGFDLDGGVSNSVIQYCLSYNNQGAGIGLFEFGAGKPWENNIIRYNISQNDGLMNGGSVFIWCYAKGGAMRNCEIYNNTFYNNTSTGFSLAIENNCPGFVFRNNIFVFRNDFLIPGQKIESELFQSNVYWSLAGNRKIAGYSTLEDWAAKTGNEKFDGKLVGKFADPDLLNPGSLLLTDPLKLNQENLSAYSLKPSSLMIDKGLDLKKLFNIDPGLHDLAGTPVPQGEGFDPGALEYINGK
jgi:hypothetical protein